MRGFGQFAKILSAALEQLIPKVRKIMVEKNIGGARVRG